jgi:hypothetical protein
MKASAFQVRQLEAASPETFRVSDAERRRKVGDARTRRPRTMVYGNFDFGLLWAPMGTADKRTDLKADRLLSGSG